MAARGDVDADCLRAGDRRTLARAITLIESTRADHQDAAQALLDALLPWTGGSLRIGITGPPGAGKSTFIEAFGLRAIEAGYKVAVLAIDPTSPIAGGSVLGDKTRMERLSRSPAAFIRPSPSSQAPGGVAYRTRESLLLCEAAGYDLVIVETVGVGQSEFEVANMVDYFLALIPPNAGDELQGIKRGIMELLDAIVVNKADEGSQRRAEHTRMQYQSALKLLRHDAAAASPVMSCSALHDTGVDAVLDTIIAACTALRDSGALAGKRRQQNRQWLKQLTEQELLRRLRERLDHDGLLDSLEAAVGDGAMTPLSALRKIRARLDGPLDD